MLSSKNTNYYLKDEEDEDIVKSVEKVVIDVNISNDYEKAIDDEITSDDIDELKEYLAEYLQIKKKQIDIKSY